MASFATRTVVQDRHVGGKLNSKDVLSPLAQRRHTFGIQSLPTTDYFGRLGRTSRWKTARRGRRRSPPAAGLPSLAEEVRPAGSPDHQRPRSGHRTSDVARKFKLSSPRVSQMRRQFEQSWNRFQWAA